MAGALLLPELQLMTRAVALSLAIGWLTSCATPNSPSSARPRFGEEEATDLVVRYYSDQTSYVLKPKQMDGAFLRIFTPNAVVDLATRQPRRELAVVVMVYYTEDARRGRLEQEWTERLRRIGFRRVVFLLATNDMKINGLEILKDTAQGGVGDSLTKQGLNPRD